MTSVGELMDIAESMTAAKLMVITAALTFYDHLLIFDDEVRYFWRGRKTWTSYLYMMNRGLLTAVQIWDIYYLSTRNHSKTFCLSNFYIQGTAGALYIFSSEIFISLRIYALTFKNKLLMVYFGSMAVAGLIFTMVAFLCNPPELETLPFLPIDSFSLCAATTAFKFKLVPLSILTAFDLSAFLVIVWSANRNRAVFGLSVLLRTIVAEATIYFLAMVTAQLCVQLAFIFLSGFRQQCVQLAFLAINPILTLRFAVSLKRTADLARSQGWQPGRLVLANNVSSRVPVQQVLDGYQDVEMDRVGSLDGRPLPSGHVVKFRR